MSELIVDQRVISCCKCNLSLTLPHEVNFALFRYKTYINSGWFVQDSHRIYCPSCIPEALRPRADDHPAYHDFHDYWDHLPPEKCRSKIFPDEPYDPIASAMQGDLCRICEYMHLGREDDGSHWMMCCVEDPKNSWGHNLYSGHFYGEAIMGRFCPYFRHGDVKGRDPEKDKKDGVFHVPYNNHYDGD